MNININSESQEKVTIKVFNPNNKELKKISSHKKIHLQFIESKMKISVI